MDNQPLQKKVNRGLGATNQDRLRQTAASGERSVMNQNQAHGWKMGKTKESGKMGSAVPGKKRTINRAENDGCDHVL